jgi:hypothetical protein
MSPGFKAKTILLRQGFSEAGGVHEEHYVQGTPGCLLVQRVKPGEANGRIEETRKILQ